MIELAPLIITLCILSIIPFVPFPGGSIGQRLFPSTWDRPKKPSQFDQLQEAALSDPLALEALRDADALLPEYPPVEPREKLAAIAEQKRIATEEKKRTEEQAKLALEAFQADQAARREIAIKFAESERRLQEAREKSERAYLAAKAEAERLSHVAEIPAIAYRPRGGKPVLVEDVETDAQLKRALDKYLS